VSSGIKNFSRSPSLGQWLTWSWKQRWQAGHSFIRTARARTLHHPTRRRRFLRHH